MLWLLYWYLRGFERTFWKTFSIGILWVSEDSIRFRVCLVWNQGVRSAKHWVLARVLWECHRADRNFWNYQTQIWSHSNYSWKSISFSQLPSLSLKSYASISPIPNRLWAPQQKEYSESLTSPSQIRSANCAIYGHTHKSCNIDLA